MRRYCTCSRGVGGKITNRTGLVHNYILGVDICSHCGGIVPKESDDDNNIRRYDQFKSQAMMLSQKGDHLSSIEFFKRAHDAAWNYNENCIMLSAIAGEYEMLGDYASAEKYWNTCREVAFEGGVDFVYRYIADKGDFLYRIGRYSEAIEEYERALKMLDDLKENLNISCYSRTTHFLIDSYEKLGNNEEGEKYHLELKHAISRFINSGRNDDMEVKGNVLSSIAWKIYENDRMFDEALILIDSAIEIKSKNLAFDYMRKAKILQGGFRYEEALKNYDIALTKGNFEKEILKSRAECEAECIKSKLEIRVIMHDVTPEHLELVNRALKVLPDTCDNGPYLNLKADILCQLGDPVKGRICRAIAAGNYDKVSKAESKLKKLKPGKRYINITGIYNYQGLAPFSEGTIVDLIKEPDNPYDRYAIRVDINGETVGYVANSKYTLIKEVASAEEIKNTSSTQAEVQFILFNEWVVAKLI